MSAYVLARLLPEARLRFSALVQAVGNDKERSYALAELNDLLTGLAPGEFLETVEASPPQELSPYRQNYVAAMVEQSANRKGVAPPAWVADVKPLEEPRFVEPLAGLRLHLLASAPVPFRRRNIFIDSAVGDRV